MRRFIFLALFAVLLCTACSVQASEVPSNPFSSFGLFYNYVTSGSVKLKVDGRADYSSVKSFVADGVKFGGMVRSDHTGAGNLPSGTLSILSGDSYSQGRKFRLWQLSYWSGGSTASDDAPDTPSLSPYAGQFIAYHTDEYYSISELAGKRVMWNLYTSPDLVAGAAVIPNISDIKPISIGVNEIVPFIKVTRDNDSFRYDLYFVRSGDWETPIAANIPVVKVNDNSYTDFAKPYPVRKTIRHSYGTYYSSFRISYAKDNADYTWVFEPESENYSTIEWGDLALSAQPLTMKTGTTKNITVKLPSALKLSRDFASEDRKREILRAGNHSVLEVDYSSMKFTQGAGWNENKTHDDKSTFSFTLIAGEPGRSVLEISIPNMVAYYREIKVTDENGNLNIPEGTTNLHARITQQARAYYVGGRPYYPSAEEGGVTVDSFSGFTGARKITQHRSEVYYDINGDKHETSGDDTYYRVPRGYAGIVHGSTHEIRRLYSSSASGDVLAFSGGAHFNTANSFDCGEYASSSLSLGNAKELESIELWLEFPESPDFNLSSIPLSKLASIDKIRTVPQQLAEFVPYFQLKHTSLDVDRMTTFEWSFVKVKADGTTEKVNPSGISNLYISVNYGDNNIEGTEGVISIDEGYWYSGRSITFSYTYDGVPYVWDFNTMNSYYDYNHFSVPDVALGASDVGYLTLYDSKDVDGIEAVIWDNDILSASPVKFTSKDFVSGGISFDVKGLKKGITKFSLVLKLTSDGYTGYRRVYRNVGVVDKITTSNIVLTPELRKNFNFPIVEGKTYYPDNLDNEKHANVRLIIAERMPASFFEANREKFYGTAYVSSDMDSTYANENSYELYPYTYYDYENGIEYVTVYYDVPYSLPVGQKVRWEFPDNNIIKAGSYTMPEIDLLTPAQAKPFVKLTRKGLNLERLEWYFVDSKDNRITEPAGIKAISVDVSMNYYLSNETFSDYTKKGYISVNVPEIFVSRVNFLFMKGGITYIYGFEPVDRPEDYYSDDSSRVISWNVGNKNLPLLLYVGESKNVVMSAGNESADLTPYIGNSDIAGVERLSSTDKSVTVKLTGKSAGMTTITIMRRQLHTGINYEPMYDEEGNFIGETPREYTYYGEPAPTWPREVWVASKNATTGKYEIPGLTNDAESFMNTLATDGTSASDGWTDYGHKSSGGTSPAPDAPKYDESPKDTGLAGLSIMPRFAMPKDPSKDAYNAMWNFVDTLGFPYGVDAFDDYNMRVIASRDPIAVFNEMSMDLISRENPSLVAVVLPEIYINESGFYMFRIPVDNIKGGMRAIFLEPCRSRDIITSDDYRWRYYGESQRDDMTRQMFLDDDGNPAGAISGDEYINVAAYFIYGRYTPVIAVEATSNDIQIIKARGTPRPDVKPTSPDVKPSSPDVRPTSPDKPAPAPTPGTTSPDVKPTSPDVTPTTSPDQPAPTPTPGTISPDVTPDTGHFTPKSAQPDAPGIDVENNPVHANTARSAIILNNPAIPANVEVRTLPDNASSQSRNVSDLPAEQRAAITAQSRDVVATLPVMSVDTAAIYTFGVTLDNVSPDTPIYLNMTVTTVTAGFVSATDDEYNSYTFLDDSGNVITTVPANHHHHVNVAAYMEPGKSYSPAITTDSSSSSSDKGDEGDEGDESGTGTNPISSSGGGCESGLGLAGMAMLAALFISKRRK